MRRLFKYARWIWGVTTILAIVLAYRVGYIVSSEEMIPPARAALQRADALLSEAEAILRENSDMLNVREKAYQEIMDVSAQEEIELDACSHARDEARGMVSSCLRELAECRGLEPETAESR